MAYQHTHSARLVPKLCLGTQLGAKLCFAGGGVCGRCIAPTRGHPLHAKQSFARKRIPKQSSGTRSVWNLFRSLISIAGPPGL